ncbi:MAG: protein kinase, partial [Pirellulaceae bacterium]|nr:protein kinase [Pirellulaceae bacterium]
MLNAQLAELEQEFRRQWQGYQPQAYGIFLEQVAPEDEVALLARLLAVELEYAYQPPNLLDHREFEAVEEDERVEPRVMLFLHRFPKLKQHRELLIQLVMLEFALRLRFDPQTPNYDSYLDLCPHEKERVGSMMQVMEEKLYRLGSTGSGPSDANQNDTTVAEGASQKTISLSQLPCSLGYFLLTDVIGHGGMGTVYNAVDLRSAAHVAVKIIHRADSWSIYRFIEEFTWLSTLNHPNVVKLYDTFSEGDLRYFSMEVVEGKPIRDWFSGETGADRWGQLRRALSQAALAVAFLHDHEVIHRDIKSSNLMITGRGRAVLLDLGLASRMQEKQHSRQLDGQQLVGTLHYLSPEALHGDEAGFPSDWYSCGVMMYETMTGAFPPVRVDMQAPIDSGQRFYLDYAATGQQLTNCPRDLASLCVDMLRTDPTHRPAAADIIRRLGSDVGQPIPFSVSDSDFVGREVGLDFLNAGLDAVQSGRPVMRLVRGESGMGKTALLNRWIKRALAGSDTLRLSIRCHSQDHTPLRALNLLVQELVTCLAQRPIELWSEFARGGGEEIAYTFPQMERLGGGANWPELSPTADSMEGVARRAAGLHALLGWLKGLSRRLPLVITIDDAHWADGESGRILSHLMRAGGEFQGLIVLIDQGAQVASPFLQGLLELEPHAMSAENTYEMPPLTRDECTRLLDCWSGRLKIKLSAEVAADILNRSGGSPFLLLELLRSYVNYIVRHRLADETWLSGGQKSSGVLNNRFSMLPPTTEKVLQFLAVSTQPLGIHQLQTASRILPGPLLAELNHLSGQGWIRWNGTTLDSELEISHERFREVVLKSMMEDRLQRRHYRLARMLSSEVPPPWRRIAHHYSEARQYREAAACYMEGARAAARRLSFAEALWMLERAFHPQAQRTELEVRAAERLKADCLAGHGNALAAAEAYEGLARTATDDLSLMQCLAGEQWIRAGRLQAGLTSLRTVLKQMG